MPSYTLDVNGKQHTVDAPADMPLLWVLRDKLGLAGTKYGCGVGQCLACAVHVDGDVTFSCSYPVSAAQGRKITTIEGLAPAGKLHPVQEAWIEVDVPQCGYCQSGQIMAAAALLARTPHPTDDEIDRTMSANLCRCGTYNRIRHAIHRAAGEAS